MANHGVRIYSAGMGDVMISGWLVSLWEEKME